RHDQRTTGRAETADGTVRAGVAPGDPRLARRPPGARPSACL
ncbi:uncharacterized protein METZ01_LOCUS286725, partial [marine metagenome]